MNDAGAVTTDKEQPKRKRKPNKKARTGCRTCRQRKVKCDEEKPICRRCASGGRICAGYQPLPKRVYQKIAQRPSAIRPLLPKTDIVKTQITDCRRHNQVDIRIFTLSNPVFSSDIEVRYFNLFSGKVARQISGYFESEIWSRFVLQAGEKHVAIRYAIVALGALELALDAALTCGREQHLISSHHCFALEYYAKALKAMRTKSLGGCGHDLRTSLLACLLVFSFETLHGNHESALAQALSGVGLLEDWLFRNRQNFSQCCSSSDMASTLPVKGEDFDHDEFGISSPQPSELEDELIQAFGRLDMQTMSFIDSRPLTYHAAAKDYGGRTIQSMPASFSSVREARAYWELVMRRQMHFIASVLGGREATPKFAQEETEILSGLVNRQYINRKSHVPSSIRQAQQKYLQDLAQWSAAFQDIFQGIRDMGMKDHRDYAAVTVLQLRYKAAFIALSITLTISQLMTDNFRNDFAEIVSLAKTLASHPASNSPFTIDLGFIPQLFVVGLRCRDRNIRREAISILLSRHWREGVWDSMLAGKVATKVMEIEEEGLEGDFVPDAARVFGTKMDFDLQKHKAEIQCFLPDPTEQVNSITRKCTVHF